MTWARQQEHRNSRATDTVRLGLSPARDPSSSEVGLWAALRRASGRLNTLGHRPLPTVELVTDDTLEWRRWLRGYWGCEVRSPARS